MDAKLLDALNKQIGVELYAEATYKSIRYWAGLVGWKGLRKWAKRAQHGEHDDAHEFADIIIDSEEMPVIPQVPAPASSFSSLPDALSYASELERTNLQNIKNLHDLAVKVGDTVVVVFLEGMLTEQQESVHDTNKWSTKGTSAGKDPSALEMLDRQLGKGFI
jgi:ferritin